MKRQVGVTTSKREKTFGDNGYIPYPHDGSQVGAHLSQKLSKLYTYLYTFLCILQEKFFKAFE